MNNQISDSILHCALLSMYRFSTDERSKDNWKRSTVRLSATAVPGVFSSVTSRSSLQEEYLSKNCLMLNSGLELVLTALTGNCCPEREGGDVAYFFVSRFSATELRAISFSMQPLPL